MNPVAGLRPRIALLVAGVVAVCVGVAFVAVYRSTVSQLGGHTRRDLATDIDTLHRAVIPGGATPPAVVAARARRYLTRQPFRATAHLLFVQAPGQRAVSNEPDLLGLSDAAAGTDRRTRAFLDAPPGFTHRSLPGAGDVVLLVREVHAGGRLVARLGVGEPTATVERAKDVVSNAFLLGGAVALLAALAGGFAVASRVAAPLRRMARVAAQVDAGDLGPRMAMAGRRDEVRVLADSFDTMLGRLQDAFDRQGAFVADASHELRTPLTVIRGQIEVLALEEDPAPEEIRHVERLVLTEVDRMSRLVEDLLLLAGAGEEGFLRPASIDLPGFIDDLVGGLARTADRRFVVDAAGAGTVVADPDRIAQALRNLLSNAVAHTAEGGLVRVSVQRDGARVRFVVDDDGPGVPPDQRDRVFDRFQRLDAARSRSEGGAGLGLAIVKAIAEAHGGSVSVVAAPEGGARFVLEIPAAELPATPFTQSAGRTPRSAAR